MLSIKDVLEKIKTDFTHAQQEFNKKCATRAYFLFKLVAGDGFPLA